MEKMTPAEYCKNNGALCPHCKSTDIDILNIFKAQASLTYQPVTCNVCGKCWVDVHGLVDYISYDRNEFD